MLAIKQIMPGASGRGIISSIGDLTNGCRGLQSKADQEVGMLQHLADLPPMPTMPVVVKLA